MKPTVVMKSIDAIDVFFRAAVAAVLAALVAMTGNLPTWFVWSVAVGGVVISVIMLVLWRLLRN